MRAVKQVHRRSVALDYKKEIAAMARLRPYPQYFAFMHGWFESDDWIYLAMDFFELSDLSQHLETKIPEDQAKQITRQLCNGLVEMHRMGFSHRDLKPQNIFIVSRSPSWGVRIGDFGISKRLQEDSMLRTMTGTQAYMAPEMFAYMVHDEEEHSYTQAVDVWALGIVLYQMLTLELAFGDPKQLYRYYKAQSDFPAAPLSADSITPACMDFIRQVLQPVPRDRLTSGGAASHTWLHGDSNGTTHFQNNFTATNNSLEQSLRTTGHHQIHQTKPMISRIQSICHEPEYVHNSNREGSGRETSQSDVTTRTEVPMTPITANITSVLAMRLPSYPSTEVFHEGQERENSEHVAASQISGASNLYSQPSWHSDPDLSATNLQWGQDTEDSNRTEAGVDPLTVLNEKTPSPQREDSPVLMARPEYHPYYGRSLSHPAVVNQTTPPSRELFFNRFEDAKGKLPPGWERRFNHAGKVYYVDHNSQRNTWERPSQVHAPENSNGPTHDFESPHRGSVTSTKSLPSPVSSPMSGSASKAPPLPPRRKHHSMESGGSVETIDEVEDVAQLKEADDSDAGHDVKAGGEYTPGPVAGLGVRLTGMLAMSW